MFPVLETWPAGQDADFDCTVVVESGVFGGLQAASAFTFQHVLFEVAKDINPGWITIKGNRESTMDGDADVFAKLSELIIPTVDGVKTEVYGTFGKTKNAGGAEVVNTDYVGAKYIYETDGSHNVLQNEKDQLIDLVTNSDGTWSIGPIPAQAVKAAELKSSLNDDVDLKATYDQHIDAMYDESAAACRAEKFTKLTSSYFVDNIKQLYLYAAEKKSDKCGDVMALYGVLDPSTSGNERYFYLTSPDLCTNDDYKFFCGTKDIAGTGNVHFIDENNLTKSQILSNRMLQYRLREALSACQNSA